MSRIVLVIAYHHGSSPPEDCEAPPPHDMRRRNLTWEKRRSIVSRLLLSVKPDGPDFKLGRRIITSTASCYYLSWITIVGPPFLRPSSEIHNAPPINATFFLAQRPWWCQKPVNPLLPASALSWQLLCHHYPSKDTAILKDWCFQHLRIAVLLFSWSVLLLLFCVLHI